MSYTLETVSEKLDDIKQYMGDEFREIKTRQDLTNGRVRALEKFQSWIMGGLAILGVILGGFLLPLIVKHVA